MRWLGLFLPLLFVFTISARAQTGTDATLPQLQTELFPRIRAYLDVHDSQGGFVHGLQASDIRILEDGYPLPVVEFGEVHPGVQLVVAIDPGASFAIRNSLGLSRYDYLVDALVGWAKSRQGSTLDDLSLIATIGPEITHISNSMDLISVLETYQIDSQTVTPSLDTLVRAVDIAADSPPRPGMERAVLYITAPLQGDLAFGLQSLTARANQQNVRIFVWWVASPDSFTSRTANLLLELTEQTKGQFFAFSRDEPIPNLESYLEPLRSIYHLAYDSRITSGGTHQLVVEIQHNDQRVKTPIQSFDFDLQPPDPAFISPSIEILRQPSPESQGNPWETNSEGLIPKELDLQVLIDFPDGRTRPLVRTRLYVDGVIVDENTKPPFDRFTWNLDVYTATGQHLLQVEASDNLGLTGASIETLFQVKVDRPSGSPLAFLSRHGPLIAALIVLLSGAVLLLVLVMGGRIRPRALLMPQDLRRGRRQKSDPVTQPVPMKNETSRRRLPGWVNRLQWPQRRLAPQTFAFLTLLSDSDQAASVSPISITANELTLGRDPNQATIVLDDPSVEPLHARLVRKEDGSFRLADEGSVAGTWINYTPVPQEGAPLEHGDLVHFGRVGFRFVQRKPQHIHKVVVTLDETQR